MLSINTIARVAVNVVRSASQPTSFDTGALLVKDSSYAAAKRLRSYANSTEAAAGLIADGFPASSEPYKAAQKYFAASPSPGRLLVSCYPNSESPVQALDALLEKTEDFYGVALADTRTDAEVLLPAGWYPVMTQGEWGYPELKYEPGICLKLTIEEVVWTLEGFFGEGGSKPPPVIPAS